MKALLLVLTLSATSWPIAGFSQTQQEHHPGGSPAQAQSAVSWLETIAL